MLLGSCLQRATPLTATRRWRVRNQPEEESPQTEPDVLGSDAPVRLIQWGGTLPSRRRLVQGLSVATFVALGGNFLGVTSFLLSLDRGQLAGETKLDVLVPTKPLKKLLSTEFQYPAKWLADQRLARRAAERIERENPLDLPSLKSPRRRDVTSEPVAAFGPAGSQGEENMSVIVADAVEGFELASLGTPEAAAEKLLTQRIAPPDSDKRAALIAASQRLDPSGTLYYTMEYTVESSTWFRHNLAVFAAKSSKLYTLNAQCPERLWEENRVQFQTAAQSFHVFAAGALLEL